ncbi:elongation factor G-like protein EF-G2 [Nocardia terpenica]|uniref:Elongation factor G-like protein n=1 Tax=Nocardia terpenica TaxID=455432 RepID=A0A161XJ57_9NOCA|nr:elongation factor G-like protein EF-G2 [Nocardia terpenica]KZM73818.1 elongation factor G [Nocardia terpenica]MBF6064563.1 elongation factor G-like protein EF-G2 [Nocardia terpenica]MBF6106813.1 elongation factor G-like protein EF-G2 [Nocardia terpenica]MBF6114531.1 elongation factor G-like protein EF-G2 [Nocardia terpenica]MBF6121383.1 elongation factor G-like protein EF-G2 [Nocardia terpenica]
MAEKASAPAGANGRVPTAERPEEIRNVVLVGHSGSGKTTLVEALAVATGAVTRAGRVEDGTCVSDYDDIEQRQHRSVQLSVVPIFWDGIKINLVDTPGYADFVGELRAGLRAADAALFVVSAAAGAAGVGGQTLALWEECAAVGMPRALVITHLDAARADFDEMARTCREILGGGASESMLPLHLPVYGPKGGDGHRPVAGLIDLLTQKVFDYSAGEHTRTETTDEQAALIDEARARLIEGIIAESEDETLMDRYLEGQEIDLATLVPDLERAVARGTFHPVLIAAPPPEGAREGLGMVEVLELITRGFPTPAEHSVSATGSSEGAAPAPLACDPRGPLAAEVIRTASDPYVGRLSLVRVFSGTLRPDETVHVCGHGPDEDRNHDLDERVGAVSAPFGKQQRPLGQAIAGDIACVTKLGHAETGDTLSAKDTPLLIEPWPIPEPLLPVAIRAHGKADEDKLSLALSRLMTEDPTVRLEQNGQTHQLVLWCLGEAHREVALERLRSRFGVQVDVVDHRVALRETFAGTATGRGRHVKQSGGHGQYAICEIEVSPLPEGSGIEFVDKVVGGVVPRQFIPSVEKGVRAQAARGVVAGYPLVDVRVTLYDGKAHSVDSSDAAFQTAGALALREAATAARIALLEPLAEVAVTVGDDYVGAVLSDLSSRRGRVVGTEPATAGRTVIRAEVPELELSRYAIDLRSLSHGAAQFTRTYIRHEAMPAPLADSIRAQAKASA